MMNPARAVTSICLWNTVTNRDSREETAQQFQGMSPALLQVLNLLRSHYFTPGSYDIWSRHTACYQTVGNLKAYRL
jgi:hypothetical protein